MDWKDRIRNSDLAQAHPEVAERLIREQAAEHYRKRFEPVPSDSKGAPDGR